MKIVMTLQGSISIKHNHVTYGFNGEICTIAYKASIDVAIGYSMHYIFNFTNELQCWEKLLWEHHAQKTFTGHKQS